MLRLIVIIFAILFISIRPNLHVHSSTSLPANFVVTNTQDSGSGSLRQALFDANTAPPPSAITFNIPMTDPNFLGYQDDGVMGEYDPSAPVVPVSSGTHDPDSPLWWRITVLSTLPAIDADHLLIDGHSQRYNQADTNDFGPEIELFGDNENNFFIAGIIIYSNHVTVQGLVINRFHPSNVYIEGDENRLLGNYIGVGEGGNATLNFTERSSLSIFGNRNLIGGLSPSDRNVIGGGTFQAILSSGTENRIVGNYIGVNAQATEVVSFGSSIYIQSSNDEIVGNVMGGRSAEIHGANAILQDNFIGIDPSGTVNLALEGGINTGICITGNNVQIGPHNVIENYPNGILVSGFNPESVKITQNRITNNEFQGIRLGQPFILAPIIEEVSKDSVFGRTEPFATIEIFSDTGNQGAIYEGATQADAQGQFQWYGQLDGPNVTATATDLQNNTSEFSEPVSVPFFLWLPTIFR